MLPSSKIEQFLRYFNWSSSSEIISFRTWMVIVILFICYLGLILRLFDVATTEEERLYKRSLFGYHKFKEERKEIIDRNGELLAVNLSTASLYANPKKIIDSKEAVDQLSKVMPKIKTKKLLKELQDDKKSFVWIKRDLTPKEQYGIHNLGIPGFYFQQDQKRVYTYSNLTSHLLGFVGRDGNGLGGLEFHFDKFLRNIDAGIDNSLDLSLDVRVQNIVSEELDKVIKKFSAEGAIGIVADVNNGEILALVNKPDFNPHDPGKAKKEVLFNKATLGAYELGSVMKIVTFASVLDTRKVQLHDLYNITHPLKIDKYTIKDLYPKQGWKTVPELFVFSSNIGTVQMVLELGKDNLRKYLKSFGFMEQSTLELSEKATPLYPADRSWGDVYLATMSYGHGLAVSPVHLVQAMIPIVNGGYLHPLTLLKKNPEAIATPPVKILDDNTSFLMNKLLRRVVKRGGARRAEVPGYLVGGKTGTANKASGGKYDKKSRFSSFISVFPMVDPKYVIYVLIDNPQGLPETNGSATGSWTAAPAAAKMINRIGTLYGVRTFDEKDEQVKNILYIEDYHSDDHV